MKTSNSTNAGTGLRRVKALALNLSIGASALLFCHCETMDDAAFNTMASSMISTATSASAGSSYAPSGSHGGYSSYDAYGGGNDAVMNSLQNQINNIAASDTVTPDMEAETFGTILGIMASGF